MHEVSDIAKLQEIKRKLETISPINQITPEVSAAIKEFEEFVFHKHEHEDCHLPEYLSKDDIEFFQKTFCEYETLLEENKAQELLSHKCSADECLYEDRVLARTFDYAIAEGKMAKITENDHILVIGSGPFPETAIGYALAFKCKVTCVEKVDSFVNISKQVIEKLGLSDKINVVHGLGEYADLKEFTKVLVTILSNPKSQIIENVMKSNADIIVRTAFGSSRLVYESVSFSDLNGFEIKDELIRWGKNFTSSILLKRRA